MASCEKCWRDSKGDPERYWELIGTRTGTADECTPEQQAGGDDAGVCPSCGRRTLHCVVRLCMNLDCEAFGDTVTESAVEGGEG